jgi:hypothetical protein
MISATSALSKSRVTMKRVRKMMSVDRYVLRVSHAAYVLTYQQIEEDDADGPVHHTKCSEQHPCSHTIAD